MFEGGETVNAELPKMPESGIFSRRFDFSDVFNLEDLQKQIKFKIINKSKKIEYSGVLDELARTPRIFSDSADNIEIQFVEDIDNETIPTIEVEDEPYNHDVGDFIDDGLYGEEDESYVAIEDDLENDFKNFGV